MDGPWLQDIESLEAISQDERARTLFLRMAELQRAGHTSSFLVELAGDPEVDDDLKGSLEAISQDERARTLFLRMAELQRAGHTSSFLVELAGDPEVDDDLKGSLA